MNLTVRLIWLNGLIGWGKGLVGNVNLLALNMFYLKIGKMPTVSTS